MSNALDLVGLSALMRLSTGRPEVVIGLIDGPVAVAHADLAGSKIRELSGQASVACAKADSVACLHGTFMAGILLAKRGSPARAICPGCTLLAYPIFADVPDNQEMPSATPEALAGAILKCIESGARIINLSLAITQSFGKGDRKLGDALDHAARRGVIVVAAAGNQGSVGGTIITRHPWVVPVAACDAQGRPTRESNLGHLGYGASGRPARRFPASARMASRSRWAAQASPRPSSPAPSPFSGQNSRPRPRPRSRPR
jgi:subtilisin family serine protease